LSANTELTSLSTLPSHPRDPFPQLPRPQQQRPGGRSSARSHRQVGNRRLRSEDSAGWWPPAVGGITLSRGSASVWPHAGGLPLSVHAAAATAAATAMSREQPAGYARERFPPPSPSRRRCWMTWPHHVSAPSASRALPPTRWWGGLRAAGRGRYPSS